MRPNETTAFRRLQELKAALQPVSNKHDLAILLIKESIANGYDTRADIVGMLRQLGLDYRHVNIVLNEGTGPYPTAHHWQLGEDGRYLVHSET